LAAGAAGRAAATKALINQINQAKKRT